MANNRSNFNPFRHSRHNFIFYVLLLNFVTGFDQTIDSMSNGSTGQLIFAKDDSYSCDPSTTNCDFITNMFQRGSLPQNLESKNINEIIELSGENELDRNYNVDLDRDGTINYDSLVVPVDSSSSLFDRNRSKRNLPIQSSNLKNTKRYMLNDQHSLKKPHKENNVNLDTMQRIQRSLENLDDNVRTRDLSKLVKRLTDGLKLKPKLQHNKAGKRKWMNKPRVWGKRNFPLESINDPLEQEDSMVRNIFDESDNDEDKNEQNKMIVKKVNVRKWSPNNRPKVWGKRSLAHLPNDDDYVSKSDDVEF